MSWQDDFPRLTSNNHRITSSATPDYNCIAWAAEDVAHWWQPGEYWLPPTWPAEDCGLQAVIVAFRSLGYEDCGLESELELEYRKIAIYGFPDAYSHAARQLPSGKWTSKLGKGEDIEHDSPDDVAGGIYGEVAAIMKRRTM